MTQPPRFIPPLLRQAPATEFLQQQALERYANEVENMLAKNEHANENKDKSSRRGGHQFYLMSRVAADP